MTDNKDTKPVETEETVETDKPVKDSAIEMVYDEKTDSILRDGKTYVLKTDDDPHPKLATYKEGTAVEVMRQGSWVVGFVQGREKNLNLLYVHTDRGPVTIASRTMIRKK